MLIGVVQYLMTSKYLGEAGRASLLFRQTVEKDPPARNAMAVVAVRRVPALRGRFAGAQFRGVIHITAEIDLRRAGWILWLAAAVFSWMIFGKGWSPEERKRAAAILVLFIASAIFWGAYEQAGSSLNFLPNEHQPHVAGF